MEFSHAVIFEQGSAISKIGFNRGEGTPRDTFPTVVGYRQTTAKTEKFVGDATVSKESELNLKFPIQDGQITNWDAIESIWHDGFFNGIRAAPEDAPLFYIDSVFTPPAHREKIAQIMFETFNVPALFIQSDLSVGSLYNPTSIGVNIGGDVVQICPLRNQIPLRQYAKKIEFGSKKIIKTIQNYFSAQNKAVSFYECEKLVRQLCFASLDFSTDQNLALCGALDKTWQAKSEDLVLPGRLRFELVETYFQPSKHSISSPGIHELVFAIRNQLDEKDKDEICSKAFLLGGGSGIPNLSERFVKEIKANSAFDKCKIDVEGQGWKTYSNASAMLYDFKNWVTLSDYEELGASAVCKKFIA